MENFITPQYHSNCLIEAVKAKIRNLRVKIYFCKPRITENGHFQMLHFMWSDGTADFDFSDDEPTRLPWYKCFWFKGAVRQFELGFAAKYSAYRNKKKVNQKWI